MNQVSIVIPALNEEEGIASTIAAIPVDELRDMGYETQILIVDGNSTDKTREIAKDSGAEVVIEPVRGYGVAFKTGFKYATGDIIVTADADATYPMDEIPNLIQMLLDEDLEFITTNRFGYIQPGAMSIRNKIGNGILNLTTVVLFQINIKDCQSGMWIFNNDILDKMVLKSNTPLSQEIKIEACHFAHCRWKEVPIKYYPRLGEAKFGGWKVGFINLVDLFRKRIVR